MKDTRYLFDEEKQTPEGMVSVSQLQTFMSCPKKWSYNYIENLTPRVERPYLTIGKLCHKGMQEAMRRLWKADGRNVALLTGLSAMGAAWLGYVDTVPLLPEEVPDMEKVREDAKSVFQQAFIEFEPWKYEVLTLRRNGKLIPALELHFVVPCAGSKGLHGYIDAILRDRETGFVWCTDYKFRKSLSPDEEEAVNIQNAVYTYACKKMGIDVTGTMTWQHVNTPAADPQILKDGSISRAKIKTTWSHYAAFCEEHGQDPQDYYNDMAPKLGEIEWYRATYEYRNDGTVKRIWDEVVVPASYAVKSAYGKNNRRFMYPWNCKMCQYKDLCQAELRDHDANHLRQTEYVKRERTRDKDILDNPESAGV